MIFIYKQHLRFHEKKSFLLRYVKETNGSISIKIASGIKDVSTKIISTNCIWLLHTLGITIEPKPRFELQYISDFSNKFRLRNM